MLTGFLRTIVLFSVTAVVLRLMGKRQLAQLQPYEVDGGCGNTAAKRRGLDFDAAFGAQPAQRAFICEREDAPNHLRQAERAGGMWVFIQRQRGGASADGGLPPAGRTGDCAGHMGMGESAGGKAGGAPGGGARRRGGSGDMNVKRLVNLQGEMYSSIDEMTAFFDEIWLDSLWTA